MFLESFDVLGGAPCFICLLIPVIYWYLLSKTPKNYPPAPGMALPVIGHMYLMKDNPRTQFKELAKKFGPAFSLRLGSVPFVVLSGYDIIKEALVMKADDFSGRPDKDLIAIALSERANGIGLSKGSLWREQRTTALTILRNLGMGKHILAERITEEVSCFIGELAALNGEPTDIKELTNACVSNVICSLIFGKRFSLDDPQFLSILKLFNLSVKLINSASLSNFIPYLQFIPFDPFHAKELIRVTVEIMKFSDQMIDEIKQTYDPKNLNNFIVAYIDEMNTKRESGQPTELNEKNLARCIDDLFGAGSETTSSTILWCLLYALHYPDKQEKVYQEIIEHVGNNRTPTLFDKPKLKYLNAFIMETQRLASIFPLNVTHCCTADTTLFGFFIPEGTNIIPSLDSVLHDETIWGDPQSFRPERFLDDQGNLKSDEHFIPFSVGRRTCPGESLATVELFLFIGSVFQRFQCLPKDSNHIPPVKDVFGLTASADSYEIRFVEREL